MKTPNHPIRENTIADLSKSDIRILNAVREVKFGSVEVTIHNGRVVQVERREKIRLPQEQEGKSDDRS